MLELLFGELPEIIGRTNGNLVETPPQHILPRRLDQHALPHLILHDMHHEQGMAFRALGR